VGNVTFDSCIMAVSIIVGGNWSNWSKPSPRDTDKLYAIMLYPVNLTMSVNQTHDFNCNWHRLHRQSRCKFERAMTNKIEKNLLQIEKNHQKPFVEKLQKVSL
jgi:hypothetical protein